MAPKKEPTEAPRKNYELLPNEVHKADLATAKIQWHNEINAKGISRRQYKYQTIATIS